MIGHNLSLNSPSKLALVIAVSTLLGACGGPSQQGADLRDKQGGRVVLGSAVDAKTLNPILVTQGDPDSTLVVAPIYESLTAWNVKTGEMEPRLADKFELSPDATTLIFTLRDGLKWSDGSAFSGDDFKFTVEATMRSRQTVSKSSFQSIAGAAEYAAGTADNISGISFSDKTITVRLTQPLCTAVAAIGGSKLIPKSV